ncbi:MAG: dihydrofolate reductase [Chitinophagaceae bacterium]
MLVSFILAASDNNVIGKNNQLPWHLPNDLKYFKNITWAMPVIMGRKTFESSGTALPGRTNVVITRQTGWRAEGAIVAGDLEEALQAAADTDAKEAFIIGGGDIFRQSLFITNKIYLTRIHAVVEGDTYFVDLKDSEWKLVSTLDYKADARHAYAYSFQVWERR